MEVLYKHYIMMCYCPSPPIPTFCDLTLRPCNWPRQGYLYHMSKCYKKSWICPLDFFPESQLLNVDQHRQASGDLPGSLLHHQLCWDTQIANDNVEKSAMNLCSPAIIRKVFHNIQPRKHHKNHYYLFSLCLTLFLCKMGALVKSTSGLLGGLNEIIHEQGRGHCLTHSMCSRRADKLSP